MPDLRRGLSMPGLYWSSFRREKSRMVWINDNLYLRAQLRMDDWLQAGLPMPIDNINYNQSNLLLSWLLRRVVGDGGEPLTEDQEHHCRMMLGPNGYTYYRMLLEKRGLFVLNKAEVG